MEKMKFAYTASYTTESKAYNRYPAGDGVHVYRVEGDRWTEIQTVREHDPAFIAFGRDKRALYVAQSASPGSALTGIVAYAVDRETGLLSKMARQIDLKRPICCLSVHPGGAYMAAADFKGNIFAIRLGQDGALEEVTDTVTLEGKLGPLTETQKCPRPHHIPFDLDGNYLVIPDKGLDVVHVYRLDVETGRFQQVEQVPIRPASCARHIAFHPDRRHVYMAAEFTSKVYVFDYDAPTGHLTMRQIVSSERSTYCGTYCKNSELCVHPNGKYLYVSNRGDDTIAVFAVDPETGMLSPVGWEETRGEIPRYFCLDDGGERMYVGNQKSGTVAVFSVDGGSGALRWTGRSIPVPCPTWILFSDEQKGQER